MNDRDTKRMAVLLLFGALLADFGCGIAPNETSAESPQSTQSELRGAGIVTFDPSALGVVTIEVDPNLRHDHDWDVCLGTLVRNGWVLTTKGCIFGVGPSDLLVQMTSTHGGPTQSAVGAEFYSHPQIDVALIKLASPFAMGGDRSNYVKPLGSGVPNRQFVRCFGMDWSNGGALKSMRFWASGGSWNFYLIDDPDQA